MFKLKTIFAFLLLSTALFAAPTEVKMPIRMEDVAARFQKSCPGHVKFSARQDTLVIAISAVDRKGGFNGVHAIGLKPLAGRVVTFTFEIKIDNVENTGGENISSMGRLSVGSASQHLLVRDNEWHTYSFKSVKIPGNGLLKMKFDLKNVSGEIQIRNPRMKGDIPKPSKSKKKSKNKKNKNN